MGQTEAFDLLLMSRDHSCVCSRLPADSDPWSQSTDFFSVPRAALVFKSCCADSSKGAGFSFDELESHLSLSVNCMDKFLHDFSKLSWHCSLLCACKVLSGRKLNCSYIISGNSDFLILGVGGFLKLCVCFLDKTCWNGYYLAFFSMRKSSFKQCSAEEQGG